MCSPDDVVNEGEAAAKAEGPLNTGSETRVILIVADFSTLVDRLTRLTPQDVRIDQHKRPSLPMR